MWLLEYEDENGIEEELLFIDTLPMLKFVEVRRIYSFSARYVQRGVL